MSNSIGQITINNLDNDKNNSFNIKNTIVDFTS